MRLVIQRVLESSVRIDGQVVGQIGHGFLVLCGVEDGDTPSDVQYCVDKTVNLRIFEDDAGKMNRSILDGGLGGILPLGGEGELRSGHKGYGLAIMVEALTGVLAQGLLSPEMQGAHGDHTSHFFLAFDPAMFGEAAQIRAQMSRYLQMLRDSEKLPGHARIYTPGEKAFEAQAKRMQQGIPVEEKTLLELRAIAKELGVEEI